MQFTVFTSTYNRAALLSRLYQSLQEQEGCSFEWIIVDDGSTDDTCAVVEAWKSEATFPIRYFWQTNQGKHVALNVGIATARGELFVVVDSDDVLPQGALKIAYELWQSIPRSERRNYMGIGALCGDLAQPNRVVSRLYPKEGLDTSYVEVSTRFGVVGDRVEFFVTDRLREALPYPTFPGEKFVPEALLWNRLARRYRMRFFNRVLRLVEYRRDGLTALNARYPLFLRNPLGARVYFLELSLHRDKMSFWRLLRTYGSYVRYSLHGRVGLRTVLRDAPSRVLCLVAIPMGLGLYMRDVLKYGGRKTRGSRKRCNPLLCLRGRARACG